MSSYEWPAKAKIFTVKIIHLCYSEKNVNLKFSKLKCINLRIFIQVGFLFLQRVLHVEIAVSLNLFYFLIKGY